MHFVLTNIFPGWVCLLRFIKMTAEGCSPMHIHLGVHFSKYNGTIYFHINLHGIKLLTSPHYGEFCIFIF